MGSERWERVGEGRRCRGYLVERHRRPPPPLVGEQRRQPRELARGEGGGGSAAALGVAPESPRGDDAGEGVR